MKNTQLDVCVRALEGMGCTVDLTRSTVRIRFPPDPNDPHGAPDGEEREYLRPFFMLLVTRVFMELMEQEIIDLNGRPLMEAAL